MEEEEEEKRDNVEERHRKRRKRKKRDPVCNQWVMMLGDVAWPGIIKHLDSIRPLIVLGMVSRSLYASIWYLAPYFFLRGEGLHFF